LEREGVLSDFGTDFIFVGSMNLREHSNFGFKTWSQILGKNVILGFVKKKEGEYFSIREGKPKRETIGGNNSLFSLIVCEGLIASPTI
jgi:hypothetical protein